MMLSAAILVYPHFATDGVSKLIMRVRCWSSVLECYNDSTIPFRRKSKKNFTVAVEGNIGSGKSTVLQYLKKHHSEHVEVRFSV